jgi:cell division protein FtsB
VTPGKPASETQAGPGADGRPSTGGARSTGAAPPAKLTSRAALLAIVVCAVALSLAYPVREYIAERRQIAQLEGSDARTAAQVRRLEAQRRELASPRYIEQLARDKLHMCFPTQTCYEVVTPSRRHGQPTATAAAEPWYALLWKSVREADEAPAR